MAIVTVIKALTGAGAGSRREVADRIRRGDVRVNGVVVTDFRHPINVDVDKITVGGRSVGFKAEKSVYLLINKPAGVLSTTRDERARRTVIDLLPDKYRNLRLYPVGRLDKDTTGLLLLTNDGDITYRLTHPRFEQEKEYLVAIKEVLSPKEKRMLENGVKLEDGVTHKAVIKDISTAPYRYSVTIHEGKKRQIRRMFEHFGHRVTALKRVRIGDLVLGDLKEGDVRELSKDRIRKLCENSSSPVK